MFGEGWGEAEWERCRAVKMRNGMVLPYIKSVAARPLLRRHERGVESSRVDSDWLARVPSSRVICVVFLAPIRVCRRSTRVDWSQFAARTRARNRTRLGGHSYDTHKVCTHAQSHTLRCTCTCICIASETFWRLQALERAHHEPLSSSTTTSNHFMTRLRNMSSQPVSIRATWVGSNAISCPCEIWLPVLGALVPLVDELVLMP